MLKHSLLKLLIQRAKTFSSIKFIDNLWGCIISLRQILRHFFKKTKNNTTYIEVDLNLNLLDHSTNAKLQDYLNLTFQNFSLPVINKPKRMI